MVRLKDIARKAGVSLSTAQQVLTGRADRFTTETQTKVRRAANVLDYRPNLNARGLQAGRSMLVGVLYSGVNHAGATAFFDGVQEGLAVQSCSPIVLTHSSIEQQLGCLQQCLDRRIDGLILNASVDSAEQSYIGTLTDMLPRNLPAVEVLGSFLAQIPSVRIDFDTAARQCVEHLVAAGHQRIVMLTHQDYDRFRHEDAPFHTDWRFSRGYHAALDRIEQAGEVVSHPLPTDLTTPGKVAAFAYQTIHTWLQQTTGSLGICCASDAQGTAVVQAIRELAGPEQDQIHVAYTGDPGRIIDCPPWCTVFAKPYRDVGKRAAEELLQLLVGRMVTNALITPTMP